MTLSGTYLLLKLWISGSLRLCNKLQLLYPGINQNTITLIKLKKRQVKILFYESIYVVKWKSDK